MYCVNIRSGHHIANVLRRQDTVDFWTSEHPLAQPISYYKNTIK